MTPARLTSLALLLTALSGAGCGEETTDPGVPLESFCDAWSSAVCDAAARCECATAEGCVERAATRCPLQDGVALRAEIEAGRVEYDPLAANRYVQSIRMTTCDVDPVDCGTTGVCFALSGDGGPCGVNHGCAEGLACVGGACTMPVADGMPCTDAAACLSGNCAAGTCAAKLTDGETCTVDSECTSERCDFATGRCRALEGLDALCEEHTDCESGYCDEDTAGAGLCAERVETGGACDEPAMCVEGGCELSVCVPAICSRAR